MKRISLITLVVVLSTFVITADTYGIPNRTPQPSHNVAVTNMSAPSSCAQGDTVPVIVTVENQGNCSESFHVVLTDVTEGKEIENQSLTLLSAYKDGSAETWDLILTGETGGKQGFGDWLWCGGDVNGDGYDDLLVCAVEWNDRTGRAYLYYGGASMDDVADRIFTGENKGDGFGSWGGGYLADMNNDGFDDVLIGARYHNGRGRAYIFYGGPDMDEKADIIIDPPPDATESSYGRGVCAGDLNGDGNMDLVVCAPKYDGSVINQGRVYLYYGPIASGATADKVFAPEAGESDPFGVYPSARGDVDGDGCDDLLIGSRYYPGHTGDGRAWLFYGDPGTTMDETCDVIFETDEKKDEFGSAIDLFDIDDDGHADVLIGARWHGDNKGRVYLYWGNDRKSFDGTVGLTFDGYEAGEQFGGGSVMGGYINDDRFGDIIVAAWAYNRGQGRAYLYYGGTKTSMDTVFDRIFNPENIKNWPMRARMADFNGDDYGDIILGGWEYNNTQGRCWLWYGGPGSSTDVTFNWDATKASTGEHTLKAEIVSVAGEEDKADNSKTITVNVKSKVKEK